MNQSLCDLALKRKISRDEALNRSALPDELDQLMKSQGAAAGAAAGSGASPAGGGGSPFGRR
jgi:hypothetical protein